MIVVLTAWVKWATSDHQLAWSKFPSHHVNFPLWTSGWYQDTNLPTFTLEAWTCMLYLNMQPNGQPHEPSIGQMKSSCYEKMASRMLIVPLLGLVLLKLAMKPISGFLDWRQYNIELREKGLLGDAASSRGHDGDVRDLSRHGARSLASRSEMGGNSTMELETEYGQQDKQHEVMELPGDRTSKIEMDWGAAVHEMPGSPHHREMDGGIVEVELDGRSKG